MNNLPVDWLSTNESQEGFLPMNTTEAATFSAKGMTSVPPSALGYNQETPTSQDLLSSL